MKDSCGTCEEEIENGPSFFLKCERCSLKFHLKCISLNSSLLGDSFFTLLCRKCSSTSKDIVKRSKINWLAALVLALHNLAGRGEPGRNGFYHWKMDIAAFLDSHWDSLFGGGTKKRKTWLGTISGIFTHWTGKIFVSGSKEIGEPGWWKLVTMSELPANLIEKCIAKKAESQTYTPPSVPKIVVPLPISEIRTRGVHNTVASAIALKERRSSISDSKPPISKRIRVDYKQVATSPGSESPKNPPPFKRKSISSSKDWYKTPRMTDLPLNLFSEDEEDFDIDEEPKNRIIKEETDRFDSLLFTSSINSTLPELDDIMNSLKSKPPEVGQTIKDELGLVTPKEEIISEDEEENDGEEENGTENDYCESKTSQFRPVSPQPNPNLVCLSQSGQEALLIKLESLPGLLKTSLVARQLRRKLKLRKERIEKGFNVFDFDEEVKKIAFGGFGLTKSESGLTKNIVKTCVLDRFMSKSLITKSNTQLQQPVSFKLKLGGFQGALKPVVSSFTGRVLKPFIRRDYESMPLKKSLLHSIRSRNPGPSPNYPIDFCYVRPHYISAINNLAESFFWPGIDMTECLQYPDFSCVALYRSVVVGFSFLVPDVSCTEAYVSFLFTHPEWRNAGIATFMLYHLIQTCMGKDITLHVSANNPAVLLYQKFGFKIEEYVLDFYDKYMPPDSQECKHALFMRLHR